MNMEHAVAQFVEECATSWKVVGSIPDWGITRPTALWPWRRLSLYEYQEYFLGGKGGRYVPIFLNSGSLKHLETLRLVQELFYLYHYYE